MEAGLLSEEIRVTTGPLDFSLLEVSLYVVFLLFLDLFTRSTDQHF
jgi:hypothetical protein